MSYTYNMISSNAQWAKDFHEANPDFFQSSADGQNPHVRLSQSDRFYAYWAFENILDALDWVCRLKGPRVSSDRRSTWRNLRAQEYCQVQSLINAVI